MKKATLSQTLSRLRRKYKEKYIDPLLFKFTRPPIMFDPDQVRLAKQLDRQMESLEKAKLCQVCQGAGVTIKKVQHVPSGLAVWNSPFLGTSIESRAYTNDTCMNCLGNGIVLDRDETERSAAKSGMFVSSDNLNSVTCPVCKKPYAWSESWEIGAESGTLEACCHNTSCKATPSLFNLELSIG